MVITNIEGLVRSRFIDDSYISLRHRLHLLQPLQRAFQCGQLVQKRFVKGRFLLLGQRVIGGAGSLYLCGERLQIGGFRVKSGSLRQRTDQIRNILCRSDVLLGRSIIRFLSEGTVFLVLAVYAAALWTCGFARIAFIGLLICSAVLGVLAIYAAAYRAGSFARIAFIGLLICSAVLSVLAVYTAAYGAGVFRLLVRTAAFFMLAIYAAAYGAGIFRLLIYSAVLSVLTICTAAKLANVFQRVIIYIA